jgi:hypothetical protein
MRRRSRRRRRRRRNERRKERKKERKKAFETVKNISCPPTPLTGRLHYTVGRFCKILHDSWLTQHRQ